MAKGMRGGWLGLVVAAALPWAAAAQDYPTKPIKLVVPYAAGGTTDTLARPFADRVGQALGQPMVVDNKGGATGVIGTEYVVRSPKDGYTLILSTVGALMVVPHLRKLPYEPLTDLTPVARLGDAISGLAIHPAIPAQTFKEFVAYAKANRGRVHYATPGIGSINHVRSEAVNRIADMGMVHVPYRGAGEAATDLISGQVAMGWDANLLVHARAGKLRLLAISDTERHPEMPDVPIITEAGAGIGFDNFEMPSWLIVMAPGGTPEPVIRKLNAAFIAAGRDAAFQAQMLKTGYRLRADSPAELQTMLRRHAQLFSGLARDIGLRQEQ